MLSSPPFGILNLVNLGSKHSQSSAQIAAVIFRLKNTENNSVVFTIRTVRIANLIACLEGLTTMISTNLQVDLVFHLLWMHKHVVSVTIVKCYGKYMQMYFWSLLIFRKVIVKSSFYKMLILWFGYFRITLGWFTWWNGPFHLPLKTIKKAEHVGF